MNLLNELEQNSFASLRRDDLQGQRVRSVLRGRVYADLLLPAFDETPVPPSPATALERYENVEGVSGSHFKDVLLGTDVIGRKCRWKARKAAC